MTDQLGDSLTRTLSESELGNVSFEIAEVGLDLLFKEGVLKDLPVISTLAGLFRTGIAVKDILFIRKLCNFLQELQDTSPEDRTRMIEHLDKDEKHRGKVGDNLLLLLERSDSVEKPQFVGKAFRAYVNEELDKSDFWNLAFIIDRLPSHYIQEIRDWKKLDVTTLSSIQHQLYLSVGVGIFEIKASGSVFAWNQEICSLLCKFILDSD